MNILFVDQFGDLGGAQQCLLDLIPAVINRGWHAIAGVPENGDLSRRLRDCGAEVVPLAPGEYSSGRKSFSDAVRFASSMPALVSRLKSLVNRHSVELLYVNGPRVLPAACAASGAVPLLFHAHSYIAPGISRRMVHGSLKWRQATVAAVSEYVAGYLRESVQPGKLFIAPNGVPDARRDRIASRVPRIGIVGRIAPEKGQLDFVEAVRLLPREWRYVICGAPLLANPSYAREVHLRAEGLPIQFTGWSDDIAAVLANLDLLAVPSTAHEALGRVILEAFSAELPVVAYASGGIPELIHNGRTGYLVNPFDPQALAARIQSVVSDEPGRRSVASNARALWEARYTLHHYRERIIEVIEKAASSATNPAVSSTPG